MANKISVLIDVATDKAVGAVGNFKAALNDAETNGTSKFKAGATSAFDSVKANAGAMALGAGTAIAGFALKAVGDFIDTAKAASDLGAATGLAREDASRWIAVADDAGISAGELEGGLGKIGKTLDDTKWAEYGISTRDAGGQARDVNDIFLDSLDKLSGIKNETERARVGNDLFGKGYGALAPLIGKTREEYEAMLGSVERGQVITDEEAAKAEKMRLAQDALKDAINEVTLAVGGLVSGLGPLIEMAAGAVGKAIELAEKLYVVESAMNAVVLGPAGPLKTALDNTKDAIDTNSMSLEELKGFMDQHDVSIETQTSLLAQWEEANGKQLTAEEELAAQLEYTRSRIDAHKQAVRDSKAETSEAGRVLEVYEDAARNAAIAIDEAEQSTRDLEAAYKELTGELSDREAWLGVEDELVRYKEKIGDATASNREKEQAMIDLKQKMIDYLAELEGIPAEQQTRVLALIDQGKFDEAELALAWLGRQRDVTYNPRTGGQTPTVPKFDSGGVMPGPRGVHNLALVAGGETVLPTHKGGVALGGGNTYNITVTSADPGQIIQLIKQYERRNGAGWRGS